MTPPPSKFIIDGYPIDVQVRFEGRYESTVTKYPVESGGVISDNIRRNPITIDVEGVVSSTPIGAIATDITRTSLTGTTLPPTDAYQRLRAIWQTSKMVVITTTRDTYQNMAMTSFTDPIESGQGDALMFQATFEQLNIVDTQRITVNSIQHQSLGAKEALLAYLGKNVRWVTSIKREPQGASTHASDAGGTVTTFAQHTPVKDPRYGSPLLSTTSFEREALNGYDLFGPFWVDHYALSPGNTESDNTMLWSDGYVVLADTGPNPIEGIKKSVQRGYYFLNNSYPHAADIPNQTSTPQPAFGSNTIKDALGKSSTQNPPGPTSWDDILKNSGT